MAKILITSIEQFDAIALDLIAEVLAEGVETDSEELSIALMAARAGELREARYTLSQAVVDEITLQEEAAEIDRDIAANPGLTRGQYIHRQLERMKRAVRRH